jgi:hypothetical protein
MRAHAATAIALLVATGAGGLSAQGSKDGEEAHWRDHRRPLVIERQGSFAVGGTVLETPGTFDPTAFFTPVGNTLHGDHAYVQYQVPPKARELPLVMWHGGGQFGKTWESTPDGREGYQSIFVRRGWSVYILDQPRRGRAGQTTEGTTITPNPTDRSLWQIFRLGIWPAFFPGVQFPEDSASIDQYWRQITPNTGPANDTVVVSAVSALFDTVGPAILLTHSASGGPGWLTRIQSENVKAIVAYEPVQFVFPEGEVPEPVVTPAGTTAGAVVSLKEFLKLTEIPIQIVYGDNIPQAPSPYAGLDLWYRATTMAERFREVVNRHGGHVSILHLPDAGLRGNTHFPFSDLNNRKVANLLSDYLAENGLDARGKDRSKGRGKHWEGTDVTIRH